MKRLVSLTLGLLSVAAAAAEAPAPLTHAQFMTQVLAANLDYAAQRYNLTAAEAGVSIARLFPDPTITAGLGSMDVYGPTHRAYPAAPTIGFGWTLQLGGKRSARIALARDSVQQTQATLDDFLRQLQAQASSAYIDALSAQQVLQRKRDTLAAYEQLVQLDELRLKAGDIGAQELAQARVARDQFIGEEASAEAAVQSADAQLAQLAGGTLPGSEPVGSLQLPVRHYSADDAIAHAQQQRADVLAAERAVQVAGDQLQLTKANRWVDVGVNLSYTHTRSVYPDAGSTDKVGEAFPPDTPRNDALGATLTVPIPLSRLQHGELTQAEAALAQAKLQLQSTQLQAKTDVLQALAQYEAAQRTLAAYDAHILADAKTALEGARYAYQRGAATLLDLLQAQRADNDLQLAHIQAQSDAAKALLALMLAQGETGFEIPRGD